MQKQKKKSICYHLSTAAQSRQAQATEAEKEFESLYGLQTPSPRSWYKCLNKALRLGYRMQTDRAE
eukprot:764218-Hanusia_phi.AAC.2